MIVILETKIDILAQAYGSAGSDAESVDRGCGGGVCAAMRADGSLVREFPAARAPAVRGRRVDGGPVPPPRRGFAPLVRERRQHERSRGHVPADRTHAGLPAGRLRAGLVPSRRVVFPPRMGEAGLVGGRPRVRGARRRPRVDSKE